MKKKSDPKKCVVFFDFDNTITTFDVLDNMLLKFSKDDRWVALEKRWAAGEIGSKECLEGQVKGIGITKRRLDEYLSKIRVDPYFRKLMRFFEARDIHAIVLSDNFDYILNSILSKNRIKKIRVYSNKITVAKRGLIPRFPFTNRTCRLCAHCKKKNMTAFANNGRFAIYIGDGISDTCPAARADLIFAKDRLLEYCKAKKLDHIPFKSLKDVYGSLKRRFV